MKTKTSMNKSVFIIERENRENSEVSYFGGFFNETDNIGTEDELQCWENEYWFESQDETWHFKSYNDAKDFLAAIQKDKLNFIYRIVLFGWNDKKGIDGCNYRPLKTFADTDIE